MSVPVSISNLFPERLYLSKGGDGDVYVNNCGILKKNQIDGLRGLYRIYKKKNPGVILNDAPESGKTVLVSLFIESIQCTLENPVLILCHNDHQIEYWKDVLLKWTRYTEDNIAINSANPYLKKNIFVQSMNLSSSFLRRNWSVLILKNDIITKEISRIVFDAEFKIWITSVDVYKDLNMLLGVGKFINPSMNIDTSEFEIQSKNVTERIKRIILLDTLSKNFVVRSDHLKSILQTNKTNKTISNKNTKKNNDATGSKIKKSKRKMNNEEELSKKAATTIVHNDRKNYKQNANEEDSPSLISFALNKSFELRNTQNLIDRDDSKTFELKDKVNDNIVVIDADIPKDENSTQSLIDISEYPTNVDHEAELQIKLDNVEDIEISTQLDGENNITKNNCSTIDNKVENEDISDDMYDKETIDLNIDSSQIELNYSEDVNMEFGNEMTGNRKIETVNEIDKSECINTIDILNDGKSTDTQVTENIKDNTIDKKLNDLETKTLMKFKGSFLDSIF